MHRINHTNDKMKHFENMLSTTVAIIGTIATIISQLSAFTRDQFVIENCNTSTVTRIDDKYIKYEITTTPPLTMAKLCVQPYLEVVYDEKHYLILLHGIFTQKAYVAENENFSLFKKEKSALIIENMIDILFNTAKSNNLDINKFIVNEDVILCFAYSESENPGTYYFLNQALPKKTSRFKALKILNPSNDVLEIDIENFDMNDFSQKIQDIVTQIADAEKR